MPDEMGQRSAYRTAGWEPSDNKTHFVHTECASSSFATSESFAVSLLRVVVFFQSAVVVLFSVRCPGPRDGLWKVGEICSGVVPEARKCNKEPGVCDGEGLPFDVRGMREVLLTSRLATRCRGWVVACCSMLSHTFTSCICVNTKRSPINVCIVRIVETDSLVL